jgi:hypothetical protein
MPSEPQRSPIPPGIDPDLYARLKAESKAPYRGLRQFVYVALGGSGFVGAIVFLSQVLAGRDLGNSLPNLGLQIGVVALMIWLYRLEERIKQRQRQR